jgi:hypothetical protein
LVGVARVVNVNPIPKLPVQRAEDEPEFFLSGIPVDPGGHDEARIDPSDPLVEDFQNLGSRSGTRPIVDDEEHIPGVIQEFGKRGAFGWTLQSLKKGLLLRVCTHLIGVNHAQYVLVRNSD